MSKKYINGATLKRNQSCQPEERPCMSYASNLWDVNTMHNNSELGLSDLMPQRTACEAKKADSVTTRQMTIGLKIKNII